MTAAIARTPDRTSAWANLSEALAELDKEPAALAAMRIAVLFSANREKTTDYPSGWFCVLAPTGTSAPVLDQLNRVFVDAVQTPAVRQKLIESGFSVTAISRTATDQILKADGVRWAALVRSTGFKGD